MPKFSVFDAINLGKYAISLVKDIKSLKAGKSGAEKKQAAMDLAIPALGIADILTDVSVSDDQKQRAQVLVGESIELAHSIMKAQEAISEAKGKIKAIQTELKAIRATSSN